MVTVIIADNGEKNVVALTHELVDRELSLLPKTRLIVTDNVAEAVRKADTPFVCLLEADCLLSPKYFNFMIGHLKKHVSRNITVDSAITSVSRWNNKFYGYTISAVEMGGQDVQVVKPQREFKSFSPYAVQVAYIPGAFIRRTDLLKALDDGVELDTGDWVRLSVNLSLYFWRHKKGKTECLVYLNPKTNYVTTEEYVGMMTNYDPQASDVKKVFERQSI